MTTRVKPIPNGYGTVTPSLTVTDVSKAIDFYVRAFNAKEIYRCPGPDGKIMHAEVKIGDSRLMLGCECPDSRCLSPSSVNANTSTLYLYFKDADAAFAQAVNAGGKVIHSVTEMFWGDRVGELVDPSGHRWLIATHTRDLTPLQIKQGAEEFFATLAKT
jgi:uncharacterized glyoxalase superfamily protein PhnB